MSFLSPALYLVLAPLVLLPLAIHLLSKGFPKQFSFPSILLIKQTMAQRSSWHRWRHLILLLLRTAFLLLLLLAFLLPVLKRYGGDPTSTGVRTVLLVLDHSASMEHTGDGPSSRERAMHEATRLIDSLASGDLVNVMLMDASPSTCFVDFSNDHSEAKRYISKLKPGLTRAEVNLVNTMATRLMTKNVSRPEIYYLSDFQRKNWAHASFATLPPAAKLFFVDVGPARRDNHAIVDARLSSNQVLAGDTLGLDVTVGNYCRDAFEGRVTVTVDRRYSFDQVVSAAPWSESRVTVPISPGGPGLHLCEIKLPDDALGYDNRFHLSLSVREKEEVLIVTDASSDRKSAAFFLKTALNPFEKDAGSLLPRIIASSELTATRLAGVQKVFFTQINPLSSEASLAMGQYLFKGGGVIYFLDGQADPQNLGLMEKAIGPGSMPLRLAQRRAATNLISGAQQVVRGDFKSRYLKLFQGAMRQNLALMEFYDTYQAGATQAGGVLLAYADDSPAMAALHHGMGTMLLLNFSASELSSNLARQRVFPAWMQELVKAISVEDASPLSYTLGETLHTEVWQRDLRANDFKNPSGASVLVRRELSGERYAVSFTPDQVGFYTLGSPKMLSAFGVNTSADEADLRPIDKDVLPKEFASGHVSQYVAGAEAFDELAKGRPLFHWFVLAALAFLLLESGFQFMLKRKAT